VQTDRPIKALFERQGQSLLPFVGETADGVRVAAVETLALPASERMIDSILRLEQGDVVWYRHLEFQAERDLSLPRRCFDYYSRLVLHYETAVFTTVVYLFEGADRDVPEAFRLRVGDRLAFEWPFDVVRLWEIDAARALESGEPGPLALVPLLKGGDQPSTVLEAVRRLDSLPRAIAEDAMPALLDLASQRYDRSTFLEVLGKDRVMQSWIYQMGVDDGQVKGKAEGEAEASRRLCADLAREFHPRVADRVLPAIEACDKPETLRAWALQCAKLSDQAFAALVTSGGSTRAAGSRAARPSRRAAKRR
jgi:predicted transposase YdaD